MIGDLRRSVRLLRRLRGLLLRIEAACLSVIPLRWSLRPRLTVGIFIYFIGGILQRRRRFIWLNVAGLRRCMLVEFLRYFQLFILDGYLRTFFPGSLTWALDLLAPAPTLCLRLSGLHHTASFISCCPNPLCLWVIPILCAYQCDRWAAESFLFQAAFRYDITKLSSAELRACFLARIYSPHNYSFEHQYFFIGILERSQPAAWSLSFAKHKAPVALIWLDQFTISTPLFPPIS